MRAASGLNFLWIIDFDYSTRAHHGGSVRYFNFAPELLAQGHTVTFVVRFNEVDKEPSRAWFEAQKQAGVFTDYVEVDWQIPRWRSRLATAVVYPGWAARILRPAYRGAMARIEALLAERKASVLLVSARRFFFVISERDNYAQPVLLDAGDSFGLYTARQARHFLRARAWKSLLGTVRPMVEEFLRERYYGRRSTLNVVVSPVDKLAFERITGRPDKTVVLLNGVRMPDHPQTIPKLPNRLIFSGNMDFPPNYEAALWFLNNVFPLVRQQVPQAHIAIVGPNPVKELQACASDHIEITGFAPDLNLEIARSALYIAPLITGSGFKNKIAEALANGTYVIGTSMATEFLEPSIRDLLIVANEPEQMADAIVRFLRDPAEYEEPTARLRSTVREQFTWRQRASELAALAGSLPPA
ncbi:MAG TPA: glycosyltransferase family 4 protein [Bryobacteraceae bacterium]|nr:glycosyltransferase family 4 protein [Bryobacteraceae bacterium]